MREVNILRVVGKLNGLWELSLDKRFDLSNTYAISVPGCVGSEVPALRDYRGALWYRKKFCAGDLPKDRRIFVRFGAVNYYTEAWLNDSFIGSHEGGYTPFIFEITKYIKPQNELLVKVLVPGENDPQYPFGEIPHGKQEANWYGIAGGIWQEVEWFTTGTNCIETLYITPDVDKEKVSVHIKTDLTETGEKYKLVLSIIDHRGKEVKSEILPLSFRVEKDIEIPSPMLWNVDTPHLYLLKASIVNAQGRPIDELTEAFGMRKIEEQKGEILLNGKPIYLMGALDQDFYPFTHYAPPSEEFVRDQLILAKEMGLNCLRYHIKVPHPWYLKWADQLGILIWEDLPNWSKPTPEAKARGMKTLEEMVDHDYNHPSVIIRTIINENWGLNLVNSEEDRNWLKKTYEWLKAKDPTRLVVDNSACFPNFHIKTDIEDFHNYFAFPDRFNHMKAWTADFAHHPPWTYSPGSEREEKKPLVVSEFGNWGLPNIIKLRGQYGGDPWWFLQGNLPGTRPWGVEERFWEHGLNKVFESIENLCEAFQGLQGQALRFQIEEMRKYPEIQGYIITEFTDLYWECNGLLDITRGKKVYFDELEKLNNLDLIFPQERPAGVWAGEKVNISVLFSHLSSKNIESARLSWKIEGTDIKGEKPISKVQRGLNEIENIEFSLPEVIEPKTFKLILKLTSKRRIIAENYVNIFVVPKNILKHTDYKIGLAENSILSRFNPDGLEIYDLPEAEVILALEYNENIQKWANEGKIVILDLSQENDFSEFGYTLKKRSGTKEGNWVSGLGMLSPEIAGRVFKEKILDYRFINDSPDYYLDGIFNFNSQTLSGMIFGWIDDPINFIVEVPSGKGKIVLTTFPLVRNLFASPTILALSNQILKNYAGR